MLVLLVPVAVAVVVDVLVLVPRLVDVVLHLLLGFGGLIVGVTVVGVVVAPGVGGPVGVAVVTALKAVAVAVAA